MSDATKQAAAASNHLEMSDEDFLNAPLPTTADTTDDSAAGAADASGAEGATADADAVDTSKAPAADAGDGDDEAGDKGGEAQGGEAKPGAEQPAGDGDDATKDGEKKDADKTDPAAKDPAKDDKTKAADQAPADKAAETKPVDYEAEYKRLLAPFKANGREVKVESVEDAISLMQMGANYNKKMAGLKPSLKILKLLENNQLLDENKLSYLIDLSNKDPLAINKLVKDSGINPMDLDAAKAGEYKPKTHAVDEREIVLDTVLDEIQDTPTYTQTLDVVSKQWDGPSKQVVAANPGLLKAINDHMSSGIYALIAAEVEREKMFGRLDGLSDIEAYRKVGDAIQARGGFNHLGSSQGKPASAAPVVIAPKPKADDEKLNEKRRAAGAAPAVAPAAPAKEFNPLGMSDADFEKSATPRFR